jgi:hypothetical protein
MTVNQFSNTSNPDSETSCIGVVTCKNNTESGLFCVYDKRVSKKFWLRNSECFLTENEDCVLNNIQYKKKTFGRNKKAKRAATIVISLIRKFSIGKYNAQLSRDILGKLLKSNDTVDSVLNALVNGSVIESNGYSNREHKIALKWRITDSFTRKIHSKMMVDGFESLGLKKRSIPSDISISEATIEEFTNSLSETPSEEPTEPFSKQIEAIEEKSEFQIDFPENSAMIFEEIKPTKLNNNTMNQELTPEEEYQQKLMVSSLSPYFKKRFAQFGLDIYGNSYCDCCKEMLPNALFSVSNSGILNHKCKMCWDAEESTKTQDAKDPLQVAKAVGAFAKNLRKGYSATFTINR